MENTLPSQPFKKPQAEKFDVVILGGGTGSTIAAWTFAAEGKSVIVVDRKYIGGSCPNIACLPSKNVIHSAKVGRTFAEATNLASHTTASRLICRASESISARW
jgi:pyruvate/2-oxoglutarate dehydrogenase complex dihydrolipoamide dehydrogenase (E3) component